MIKKAPTNLAKKAININEIDMTQKEEDEKSITV